MSVSGKIALVTLIHVSDDKFSSADELAEQIRQAVESSSLSATWTVDRVTVLDESASTAKILTSQRANSPTAL